MKGRNEIENGKHRRATRLAGKSASTLVSLVRPIRNFRESAYGGFIPGGFAEGGAPKTGVNINKCPRYNVGVSFGVHRRRD